MLQKVMVNMLELNPFNMEGEDNFLLTSGNEANWNTMTCDNGSMGKHWGLPVFTVGVTRNSYTRSFLENYDNFTICFMPPQFDKVLEYCGNITGRGFDKRLGMGINPYIIENGFIGFEEASLIFCCSKLYSNEVVENKFFPARMRDEIYPTGDFHTLYTGIIREVYCNE